jgi:hypothetical protein|tara:strand:- start:535 stop:993 length:459 start_codon:yes stop_codon:yes gene_type:complete
MQIRIKKEDAERDAPLIGMQHPVLSDFKLLKKNKHEATYEKIDPLTFTRTYLNFNHATKEINVWKHLPKEIANTAVKLNKQKQNDFDGYRGKEMVQQYAVPEMLHQQLKEQAGLESRTGLYDEKKVLSILDDPDNKYLKTVPHKIGNRKREI